MSTPDSRYVGGFTSRVEEAELRRRLGLDADAIAAGEAGVTEMARIRAGRLQHPVEGKVADRIGAEIAADLLGAVTRADQLLACRRVDAVVAGPLDRRRRDPHVDLARAGALEHPDDLAARGPAHDRVVDDHDAPPLEHLPHGIELHLDAEMADPLLGLDERAPHVVVPDQAHLVRRAR